MYRLGIDLGGTKIECAILDPNGRVLARQRVPTEAEKGVAHIFGKIKKNWNSNLDHLEQLL